MPEVVRLSPRAARLSELMAKAQGKKQADFIHELIIEAARGLSFDKDMSQIESWND